MKATLTAILRHYREALLLANVDGIDYSADKVSQGRGGKNRHGGVAAPSFGAEAPLAVAMERRLARVADVMRREVEQAQRGPEPRTARGDRQSASKAAEDRAILSAVGDDPTKLAYLWGRTTEGVRKLRIRHGQDPATGERVAKEPPITRPYRRDFAAA